MKTIWYDRAVLRTLNFYEKWILPDNDMYGWPKENRRISLREAKLKEFRIRRALMNPYDKTRLLETSSDEERNQLEKVAKDLNFVNCTDFTISFDRHKGLYGDRVRDFPNEY